jgi:hypothetical protein
MRIVVNCGTADIHADMRRVEWFKFFFLSGERVVNLQSHLLFL